MKCTIFYISFYTCARVMSCRTRERAKCHIHAYNTRIDVLHTLAKHVQTNLSAYVIRCNVVALKKTHITMAAHKI